MGLYTVKLGLCRAVSKEVTTPNQPLVIALLQNLPQLPPVPRLQHTAALTLGSFAQWMATALDQGHLSELMPQLLQMLSQGEQETICQVGPGSYLHK